MNKPYIQVVCYGGSSMIDVFWDHDCITDVLDIMYNSQQFCVFDSSFSDLAYIGDEHLDALDKAFKSKKIAAWYAYDGHTWSSKDFNL